MTKQLNHKDSSTQFGNWLRALTEPDLNCRAVSLTDNDHRGNGNSFEQGFWQWFKFIDPSWFMWMEEKRNECMPDMSQTDNLNIMVQGMRSSFKADTVRGSRDIEFKGLYIVSFEHTTPDDGDTIIYKHDPEKILYRDDNPYRKCPQVVIPKKNRAIKVFLRSGDIEQTKRLVDDLEWEMPGSNCSEIKKPDKPHQRAPGEEG